MVSIPGFEGINWGAQISSIMYWVTYILLAVVIIAAMVIIWNYTTFKINATIFPLYGSGKDGIFSVGKRKKNKVKWVDKKTAWKSLFPIMNKIKRQPFDAEYIYPGNNVFIFELGDQWIPGRINIDKVSEEELRVNIDPIPSYLRNWEIISHKQIDQELASGDFMSKYGQQLMTIGTVLFCLILCGVTIWMAYKMMNPTTQSLNNFADAIRGITNVAGAPR